jgi:hypothetical protein
MALSSNSNTEKKKKEMIHLSAVRTRKKTAFTDTKQEVKEAP